MTENQQLLEKCKLLIEDKLGWGNSRSWQSQDFENLSKLIFEKNAVLLSASTLKRIWGKIQYNSTPNLSTLDALAKFVDYSNWRSFAASVTDIVEIKNPVINKKYIFNKPLLITCAIVIATFLISLKFLKQPTKKLIYSAISFSSKPVTFGVPNTIIFTYDASQSNADSVFIQQSWDPKRRFKVDKNQHEYTSTYYMPGFYRAKLILNDSVIREHDILIESKNWMGMLSREPVPIYLPEKIFNHDNYLGITETDLNIDQLNYQIQTPTFILTNVSRNFNVSSQNFVLGIEIQNTYSQTSAPCKQTSIMLIGTEGIINIPLSAPGCVGELKLRLGDQLIEGITNNLSAFGVNFEKPIQVRCITKSNRINIDLNGKSAYEGSFNKNIGQIVGIRVSFEGTGYIKSFELNDKHVG